MKVDLVKIFEIQRAKIMSFHILEKRKKTLETRGKVMFT